MIDYVIPKRLVQTAFYANWDKDRSRLYAATDGEKRERSKDKVIVGNLAEVATYGAYCGLYGIPCNEPNLMWEKKPGKEIWPDDLKFMYSYKLGYRKLKSEHSVKGQKFSVAKQYGASWMFQLEGRGRKADPMVNEPKTNCLFIGVLIDDSSWSLLPDISVACKIYTFFWPQVVDMLKEPAIEKHIGFKKALYLRDIELKEIDHDQLVLDV